MQSEIRIIAIMIAAAFLAIPFAIGDGDAEQAYDKDYGDYYSYTLQFVFDGSDAQTIQWEFGDGAVSTEWNPRHTYSDKGTYYVTQTTTNPKGTTVEIYKVQVFGFPVISFDSDGGSSVSQIQQSAYNVTASKPTDPVKTGYRFDGWYCDEALTTPMDWSAGVTKSMTLYAGWTLVSTPTVSYTVSFDSKGGSSVPVQTIQSGNTVSVPEKPVRSGYTFVNWLRNGSVYDFDTPVTSSFTLVASWIENTQPVITHNIVFDTDGGSLAVSTKSVQNGLSFTLPSYDGTKNGYTFIGWSCNNVTYQPGNTVTVSGDMTFKALWSSDVPTPSDKNVIVTFDVDGGSIAVESMTVKSGSTVTLPSYDGKKDGCSFKGWGIGMLTYQPGETIVVSGNVTAKALWDSGDSGDSGNNGLLLIVLLFILILIIIALAMRKRRGY